LENYFHIQIQSIIENHEYLKFPCEKGEIMREFMKLFIIPPTPF
jgi:hypothetical protein